MRFILSLFAVVLLSSCSTAPTSKTLPAITHFKPDTPVHVALTRDQLVGWWYGDQPATEGGRVQWIMRRARDGTFRITFRNTYVNGRVAEQTEIGEWGVSANYIITVTRGWVEDGVVHESPRRDSYFWDLYETLESSPTKLRYVSVESRNEYRVTKVADGFEFPK